MTLHFLFGEGLRKQKQHLSGRNIERLFLVKDFFFPCLFGLLVAVLSLACTVDERQSGIPSKAQEAINVVTEDFKAGRYEKIYTEAADQWRARVTLEESNEIFRTLKDKLGAVRERTFMSGRQQQTASGELPANSIVIRYNTTFERAEGMETFTLIESDGRYLLAGYSVSSNVLQ